MHVHVVLSWDQDTKLDPWDSAESDLAGICLPRLHSLDSAFFLHSANTDREHTAHQVMFYGPGHTAMNKPSAFPLGLFS